MTATDDTRFRQALGCFATGITVVTATTAKSERIGITANSFTSVSLTPPLVLVSLAKSLRSLDDLLSVDAFAINLLQCGQQEISTRFACAATNKWAGVAHGHAENGSPLLDGRLAHFECRPYARHDAGDHVILIGEVTRFESELEADPLVFYRGAYRRLEQSAAA